MSRSRNFTYSSSTLIDIKIKYIIRSGDKLENEKILYNVIPKVHIGKIPIMLQSSLCLLYNYKHMDSNVTGECKYDPGVFYNQWFGKNRIRTREGGRKQNTNIQHF